MQKLIDEIVTLQKGTISNGTVKSFEQLKSIDLPTLSDMIMDPTEQNGDLIATVGTTLNFGTINRRLFVNERKKLEEMIENAKDYDELSTLLRLFEELASNLTPHLSNHPMAQEIQLLDSMLPLAEEQSKSLDSAIVSIPSSTLIALSTDNRRTELLRLSRKIRQFKTVPDYEIFTGTVLPEIEVIAQNKVMPLAMKSLFAYTVGKTRTQAHADPMIRELFTACHVELLPIQSKERDGFVDATKAINRTYDDYTEVVKKMGKYYGKKSN